MLLLRLLVFGEKNRNVSSKKCLGTDINRNFNVGPFCGDGTSKDPCAEDFCGSAPFSEPESQAIRDTIWPIRKDIDTYVSFHAFGLMWMFPYSYKNDHSQHHAELLRKATAGAKAIEDSAPTGTKKTVYRVGTIAKTIYKVTGSSVDWVYEKAGVKNSYILELQPGSVNDASGFLLACNRILPTCKETMIGISKMLLTH